VSWWSNVAPTVQGHEGVEAMIYQEYNPHKIKILAEKLLDIAFKELFVKHWKVQKF